MNRPLQIFIGYDSKEPIAYHVLAHSILTRASVPVSITPLTQPVLRQAGLYTRERGATESTEFSLTRFLVPALAGYRGHALFLDCDMLCRSDITELWAHTILSPQKAVYVCQHDYTPKSSTKFLGQVQTAYPRKNWSSVMLFDCEHYKCRELTPEKVNTLSGLELHRLLWAEEKGCDWIGSLPLEWNWLVGEYQPNAAAKLLHYTLGGPWFEDSSDCDYAGDWHAERELACSAWQPAEVAP
jgi:hypothetical protein